MDKKTLNERYAKAMGEMKAMVAKVETENREMNATENAAFDQLEAECRAAKDAIEKNARQAALSFAAGDVESIPPKGEVEMHKARLAVDPRDPVSVEFRQRHPNLFTAQAAAPAVQWVDAEGREVRSWSGIQGRVADAYPGADDLSIGRAIRGLVTGDWRGAGMEQRAMSSATASGGYLIPQPMSATVIDVARAASVVFPAGAQLITMDASTLDIARLTADPTITNKAEGDAFTPVDLVFDRVRLTASTFGCVITASRELIADAPNAQQLLERALANALAAAIDSMCLNGSSECKGLLEYTADDGMTQIASVGALTDYAEIIQAWRSVALANGQPNAVVMSPREASTLDAIRASADGQYLLPPANIAALSRLTTTALAINGGTGENESSMLLGDFRTLLVGLRQAALLEISTEQNDSFLKHLVSIKVTWRGDVGVPRPTHFCALKGITA